MPEAVIVSTARSPIGRAGKGSLAGMRPDDLAAQMVRAALDKVPRLDPEDIDDLMLGCGLPDGESGFNMGRAVAVELGYDHLPGCTITRYYAPSLQTTRMALHAIKAGEGDVFISAGVETVSRFANGSSDSWPDTHNPIFAEAQARTDKTAAEGTGTWTHPRENRQLPDVYIAMGHTAENLAQLKNVSREEMDEFAVRSQNLAEKALTDGFWGTGTSPRSRCPTTPCCPETTGRARASRWRAWPGLMPMFRPDGRVTAGNCCPLNDGTTALVIMSGTKARELGEQGEDGGPQPAGRADEMTKWGQLEAFMTQ